LLKDRYSESHQMAPKRMAKVMADDRDERDVRAADGTTDAQMRDQELCRMAAFRLREAANRIATLANSAQDERLRSELIAVCDRLLQEEHDLLATARLR
jgi:hypothetical protein